MAAALARIRSASTVGEGTGSVDFDALYSQQWWPMLRLAKGLVDDTAAAEDVVQDAFAALYRRRGALRDPASAVGYLRTSVVNGSRSALRRRGTARRYLALASDEHAPAADRSSLLSAEQHAVRQAMAALPDRQREVLTLRFLGDLTDVEIATAVGISHSTVRSAASRGLATLRTTLGGQL